MIAQGLKVLIEEATRHEAELPAARRALLYRGLAEVCGCPHQSALLRTLARQLEEADRRCREFRFELPTETPPSLEQTAKMAV